MKTFLSILLFVSNVAFSQLYYLKVDPKSISHNEHKEGYYDNIAIFTFYIRDYNDYEQCSIVGYFPDYINNIKVVIKTGQEYQYTEKELTHYANSFSARITTYNLPKLAVVVYYDGDDNPIWMENVNIELMYKK